MHAPDLSIIQESILFLTPIPITFRYMKKHASPSPFDLPFMFASLAAASWETIFHRSMMMAQGTCSIAEYQRMVTEKAAAMQASTVSLMTGGHPAAALAPFLTRSRANARRLRSRS
jgi:hypothetical protein